MKKFIIRIKEKGNYHIITTSHTGDRSRESVVNFFGLEDPDVEWYEIEEAEEP